jgi:hypothetical protein
MDRDIGMDRREGDHAIPVALGGGQRPRRVNRAGPTGLLVVALDRNQLQWR